VELAPRLVWYWRLRGGHNARSGMTPPCSPRAAVTCLGESEPLRMRANGPRMPQKSSRHEAQVAPDAADHPATPGDGTVGGSRADDGPALPEAGSVRGHAGPIAKAVPRRGRCGDQAAAASKERNPRPKKPATDPTPDQQILKQPSEGRRRSAAHMVSPTRL
jgi:hypothetical protein